MFQYLLESDALFWEQFKNIMKYKYPLILPFQTVSQPQPAINTVWCACVFCMKEDDWVCLFPGLGSPVQSVKESSLVQSARSSGSRGKELPRHGNGKLQDWDDNGHLGDLQAQAIWQTGSAELATLLSVTKRLRCVSMPARVCMKYTFIHPATEPRP